MAIYGDPLIRGYKEKSFGDRDLLVLFPKELGSKRMYSLSGKLRFIEIRGGSCALVIRQTCNPSKFIRYITPLIKEGKDKNFRIRIPILGKDKEKVFKLFSVSHTERRMDYKVKMVFMSIVES